MTGEVVEFDEDYTLTEDGTYQLTGEHQWCQFESPCIEYTYVSIEEFPEPQITVFPNPATYATTIQLSNVAGAVLRLRACDGRFISELKLQPGENLIDLNSLSPGIYVLEISTPHALLTEKLVVE